MNVLEELDLSSWPLVEIDRLDFWNVYTHLSVYAYIQIKIGVSIISIGDINDQWKKQKHRASIQERIDQSIFKTHEEKNVCR